MSSIISIFKASQSIKQDGRKAQSGIKIVPSGKMYVNLKGIKADDTVNVVFSNNCIIFRLATSEELELSKKDKAIASHLYKVSGNRHAVSVPQWARDMLKISETVLVKEDSVITETVDGLCYYQVLV